MSAAICAAGPAVARRCGAGGFEAGEAAGGEDGFGGVPVGPVPGVAGLGVGAEDLAGVVGGDLVLVAVGGDHADVAAPLAGAVRGRLAAGRARSSTAGGAGWRCRPVR